MKKIILIILCITSLVHFERSYAQDMDEFDLQAIGVSLKTDCDYCSEYFNLNFTSSSWVSTAHQNAINYEQNIINSYNAWCAEQEKRIEIHLEEVLDKDFRDWGQARNFVYNGLEERSVNHLTKDIVANHIKESKIWLDRAEYPLRTVRLLQLRKSEIEAGNLDNSVLSFSEANNKKIKNIRSTSEIESSINSYLSDFSDNKNLEKQFLSASDKALHWDENLINYLTGEKNKLLPDLFARGGRIETFQYGMGLYLYGRPTIGFGNGPNDYLPYMYINKGKWDGYITGDTSYANEEIVSNYAYNNRNKEKFILSENCWFNTSHGPRLDQECQNRKDAYLKELMDSYSLDDARADIAIIGLGERNNAFLDARPYLRKEIVNYFKENNFSQVSHDAINYLLNQYQDGRMFIVDNNVYGSSIPPMLSDASNPERALEFCSEPIGDANGLPYFGNVLAEFFKEVDDDIYEGFIIRNMLDARVGNVPSDRDLSDSWYGENFKFVNNSGGCIKIHFENENGSYLPQWFFDQDNDGYHAKGTSTAEHPISPGPGWRQGKSKGEDCDDTKFDLSNNCIDELSLEKDENNTWDALSTVTDFGLRALEFYVEYEDIIDASLSFAGGVITTAAGITLAGIPGTQGLAVIAITYGTAQAGFGLAKLSDAIKQELDPSHPKNPRLAASNNFGQLMGNDLEEKGIPHAGEVGFYLGETIEFASNLTSGIVKLNRAKSLFESTLAGLKISRALTHGIETSVNAAFDIFITDANNKIANITNLKSKIDFIEVEGGIEVQVLFEASNDDGDLIRELKTFIIKADQIIENGN